MILFLLMRICRSIIKIKEVIWYVYFVCEDIEKDENGKRFVTETAIGTVVCRSLHFSVLFLNSCFSFIELIFRETPGMIAVVRIANFCDSLSTTIPFLIVMGTVPG